MIRRPPRSTRTDTLFPYTTLFRSGFAGTDPRLERQKVLLQAACYIGVLLACGLLVFGLATSYRRNGNYLADVHTALAKYPGQSDLSLAPNQQAYFALVLERLEALSAAVDVADQHQGDVPLSMRRSEERRVGKECVSTCRS